MNSKAIVDALKKSNHEDYTLRIIPNVNHGFQLAKTGSPSEYTSLEKEFAPGFLEHISDWILERVDLAN